MAESRQFGAGRVFGDKAGHNAPGASEDCAQCEAMLTDSLDGTLTGAEQATFDLHAANCAACGQIFADAKRGAAWLEMLRHPAPEPPADLLERILAQTSAAIARPAIIATASFGQAGAPQAAPAAGYVLGENPGTPMHSAKLIPFPWRAVATLRRTAFGQIMLQPRLAMTAAMAFFSIALTLNITGFHPGSLRASDLTPGSLRRDVISANTQVVRYYESLRVVYELESRVHDLESAQDNAQDTTSPVGASSPAQRDQPGARPVSPQEQPKAQPQPAGKRPAPGTGTSRREEPDQPRRFLVSELLGTEGTGTHKPASIERRLV